MRIPTLQRRRERLRPQTAVRAREKTTRKEYRMFPYMGRLRCRNQGLQENDRGRARRASWVCLDGVGVREMQGANTGMDRRHCSTRRRQLRGKRRPTTRILAECYDALAAAYAETVTLAKRQKLNEGIRPVPPIRHENQEQRRCQKGHRGV